MYKELDDWSNILILRKFFTVMSFECQLHIGPEI